MINAIIVDDERKARELLQYLIEKEFSDKVKVCDLCASVAEATESLTRQKIDLAFLDIKMPKESGFELITKFTPFDFEVVFVTAYNDFAVQAFKVNALDYLVKPIDIEELRRVIKKTELRLQSKAPKENNDALDRMMKIYENPRIGIPTLSEILYLEVRSIIRCEASSNYTKIKLDDGKDILVSRTLGDIEQSLEGHDFLRIHRSHLINMKKVISYSKSSGGQISLSDGSKIPVSESIKSELERRLSII